HYRHHRNLHSFPTRRSSDLTVCIPTSNTNIGIAINSIQKLNVAKVITNDRKTDNLTLSFIAFLRKFRGDLFVAIRYINILALNIDRKSTRLNSSHVKISYAV